jgi:hypothetical protein
MYFLIKIFVFNQGFSQIRANEYRIFLLTG